MENWHLKDSRNSTHMKGHKILTRKKKGKSEDSSSALPQISGSSVSPRGQLSPYLNDDYLPIILSDSFRGG